MNYYKKITIWENNKRVRLLSEFRELVVTYFNNIKYLGFGSSGVSENEKAREARIKINMILDKMYFIIISAGVNPIMYYTPPPAIGGLTRDIDLVINIFNLYRFRINPQLLLDFIERAIGVYENDGLKALLRTVNPFFWLGLISDYIVSLPFKVFGEIGFNQEKIESSITGKIIKGIIKGTFYLITFLASFLAVLKYIGYLEKFILLIQGWIKYIF